MARRTRLLIASLLTTAIGGAAIAQTQENPARSNQPLRSTAAAAQPAEQEPAVILEDALPPPLRGVGRLNLTTGDVITAELPNLLTIAPRPVVFDPEARHVLQLDRPMTPQLRVAIAQHGINLGQYLPTWSFIITLQPDADLAALSAMQEVIWLGEYRAAWKIGPSIGQRTFATPYRQQLKRDGMLGLIVTLFQGAAIEPALAHLQNIEGVRIEHVETVGGNPLVSILMPSNQPLAQLAALHSVQFIEEAYEVTLRNDTTQWIIQSNQTNVTPLYDHGLFGEGQIVGILDGRININHCAFLDDEENPIGSNHRKVEAYNSSIGSDPHGTHVAGIAVGDGGPGPNLRGIAWLGRLVFHTVPAFTEAGVTGRLGLHHSQGARIHSNSWGDDGTTEYNSLARGFDVFLRDNEDDVALLAITNLNSNIRNPENAKNLIAVSATKDTPDQDDRCIGGRGPTDDGRRKPDIMAPGCLSMSANNNTSSDNCLVINQTGTSMATPAVAGIGLLVREYFMRGYYPTGMPSGSDEFTPSGALIKAAILNSGVDATGTSWAGENYPSMREGWGRVLADETLHFAGDTRSMYVEDIRHASGLQTGLQHEYPLVVASDTEKLKITMVFTDVPGTAGAALPVVNDLDLQVISPLGAVFRGNVFNTTTGVSATGGAADPLNNVEQVHINNPPTGIWTIRVIGTDVSVGPQGYAIIASGDVSSDVLPLNISIAGGAPETVEEGQPTDLLVEITDGFETLNPTSPQLFYRFDDGSYTSVALSDLGGDLFTGAIPPAACEDEDVDFFILAFSTDGTPVFFPANVPTDVFTAIVNCAAPCPGDLNGDGVVNVTDLLEVIANWGGDGSAGGDANSDGVVNVTDLLIVISNWGSTCP